MPKVVHTEIYDDVIYRDGDGEEVAATEVRTFSVGNKAYQTYLSEPNAKLFDDDVAKWTEFAEALGTTSRSGGGTQRASSGGGGGPRKPRKETNEIRAWAKDQNFDPPVSDRGRIPEAITRAYYQAHPDKAPA